MQIIPVSETNLNTYYNLAQTYEAEFSPLTQKQPDPSIPTGEGQYANNL